MRNLALGFLATVLVGVFIAGLLGAWKFTPLDKTPESLFLTYEESRRGK